MIQEHRESTKTTNPILVGKLETQSKSDDWKDGSDPWSGVTLGVSAKGVTEETKSSPWARYVPTMQHQPKKANPGQPSGSESTRLDQLELEMQQMKKTVANHQQETRENFQKVGTEISNVTSNLKLSLQNALREQSATLMQQFSDLLKRSPRTPTADSESRERSRSHGR